MRIRNRLSPVLLILLLSTSGCGQKPASKIVSTEFSDPKSTATPDEESVANPEIPASRELSTDLTGKSIAVASADDSPEDLPETQADQAQSVSPLNSSVGAANPKFDESLILPAQTLGLIVARPRQIVQTPIGQFLSQLNWQSHLLPVPLSRIKISAADIERVTCVIDQSLVNEFARYAGITVLDKGYSEDDDEPQKIVKKSLGRIGQAFRNYHDNHDRFPRADGDANSMQTGLSWRVHLLPFLNKPGLYSRFHLDEPWDSEHNRALISEMPSIYQTSDVTEAGRTAFHVFTGLKTAFHGPDGSRLNHIKDGANETFLAIKAASDRAEIWTKPGGIEFNPSAVRASLGNLGQQTVVAVMFDGSVIELSETVDDATLALLVQPNDGLPINPLVFGPRRLEQEMPTIILTATIDLDQKELFRQVLERPREKQIDGENVAFDKALAVWLPHNRQVVIGRVKVVNQMIALRRSNPIVPNVIATEVSTQADVSFVFNMASQTVLIEQVAASSVRRGRSHTPPGQRLLRQDLTNIKLLSASLWMPDAEKTPWAQFSVRLVDEQARMRFGNYLVPRLERGRVSLRNLKIPPTANSQELTMIGLIQQAVNAAEIVNDGNQIQIRIPAIPGIESLPELLKPTLLALLSPPDENPE